MSIMDIVKKFGKKNELYNELDAQDKASTKVEERKLSANERELNKIMKQKREDQIKNTLNRIHKQEANDYWHKDVISQKELFKSKRNGNDIMNNDNMFVNQKALFLNSGRMI